MRVLGSIAFAATAALMPAAANAAVVVDSLPYAGTPDWTDIQFDSTSMTTNGTTSTLATNDYRGVWFGWGTSYGDQPGWSPGSSAQGNYLSMTASFGAGSADWSAYFYDGSHYLSFEFVPTGCVCYGQTPAAGVNIYFRDPLNSANALPTFVALNPSMPHTYEFLLKGGQLTYRIDGIAYTGLAAVSGGGPLLVIGDGSGPTPTGRGSMTIHGIAFDNAPNFALASVPEPGSWAMMIGGFGLAGAMLRRRRKESVAVTA